MLSVLNNTLQNLCTMEAINNTTYCSAEDFLHSVTQKFEPGCLILDLRMPGMSGIELQSKSREKYSPWPIIFLTGHGKVHTAVEALKRGALDFLEKPVDNDVLISKVKKALAMSESLSIRAEMESNLTHRERDVLGCLEFGFSIKETAN